MVSFLLGLPEVKVNDVDGDGNTALSYALCNIRSNLKVIKLLLNAGADVNHR